MGFTVSRAFPIPFTEEVGEAGKIWKTEFKIST
jgi:hypothetical protein